MKNKNINALFNFLTPLPLDLEKSSARRRFLRHIKGFKEDFDLEGNEIRKEFSEKTADGAVKIINDTVQFTKENRKLADVKFDDLNVLEIPIDWSGEEQDKDLMITIIKDKITELKTAAEFNDNVFEYIETLEEIVTELKNG